MWLALIYSAFGSMFLTCWGSTDWTCGVTSCSSGGALQSLHLLGLCWQGGTAQRQARWRALTSILLWHYVLAIHFLQELHFQVSVIDCARPRSSGGYWRKEKPGTSIRAGLKTWWYTMTLKCFLSYSTRRIRLFQDLSSLNCFFWFHR